MKRLKIVILVFGGMILIYFGAKAYRSISVVKEQKELRTDHFLISYHGVYKTEAEQVAESLEDNYERIRNELNDPEHDVIKVFIHPTQSSFNKGTGLSNSNAKGVSRGPFEFHIIWTNWYNSILPGNPVKTAIHEFTHCVQLNILIQDALSKTSADRMDNFDKEFEANFLEKYPQWFWEAICDYEAGIVNNISVKYGMRNNPTLKDLNSSNQIYNVGYTIIEYIVAKWGKEKLPLLIKSYVDTESVLNISEADFEKGWIQYVGEKY